MKKRLFAALLAGTMIAASLTGCGYEPAQTDSNAAPTGSETAASGNTAEVSQDAIRFMNSKIEIDGPLKAFAEKYKAETGQEVIIESLGGGVDVNGQIKNYYAAGNMPDIFAYAADSYQSFKDWLTPLDGEAWTSDTDYAFKGEDGKIYGFPFAIEGIGLTYNKDVLDKAGIDPSTLTNIDAYQKAFEKLDGMKDELGLQSVCAVAAESGQMYWSTGNHMMSAYLSQGLARDDKSCINLEKEGKLDPERANPFADWVSLLYQYSDKNVLISGTYDDQLALWAQGKAAFITQGSWIDPSLKTYDVKFQCGIAPAAFMKEDTDGILADAPAIWGIYNDSSKIDACKKFLNALAATEEGQKCLVTECGMVSPYKSCKLIPESPLAASIIPYIQADKTYAWDWLTQPEGLAQNSTGAVFELFAKNEIDKAGFVDMLGTSISDYISQNQ